MYFTSDDGFQNMFVYQPKFSTLKYENTSTEYVIRWKSKGVHNSKLIALLHSTFLPTIKCFEYIIGIQFNKTPLVVEQNN